ncbi:MAG: hypothetical protein AAGA11_01915 [Pseudomonadota bacterium]
MTGWIGVDLDGTLAQFDRWRGPDSIGLPIPAMVKRVEAWVAEGREVRLFTARASDPRLIPPIKRWLKLHGLPDLKITNVKDFQMIELWDDRAVQVIHNTGRAVQPGALDEQERPELIDVDAPVDAAPPSPVSEDPVVTPSEAEVEAFKRAVKARARAIDESLLDALDSGEDYTPTSGELATEPASTPAPMRAPVVPPAPAAPTVRVTLGGTTPEDELAFPSVDSALQVQHTPEHIAAVEDVEIVRRSPFDQLEPRLEPPPTHRPDRATQFPALSVDEDDWDSGVPKLRVDAR